MSGVREDDRKTTHGLEHVPIILTHLTGFSRLLAPKRTRATQGALRGAQSSCIACVAGLTCNRFNIENGNKLAGILGSQ